MPLLLRRSMFAAVVVSGASLFAIGVQGVAEMDTRLEVAAQRTVDHAAPVRYDGWDCPGEPARNPRV
jgi:hypothetical protein